MASASSTVKQFAWRERTRYHEHLASAVAVKTYMMKATRVLMIAKEGEMRRMERRGRHHPVAGQDAEVVKPAESHEKVGLESFAKVVAVVRARK